MSRTLRRPMFRGGPVSSYNTGITSGLDEPGYADGGRVAARVGGFFNFSTQFGRVLSDVGLMGRGILSDLYNIAGVPTNIATEFFTGYNPGFSGERIFGLEGKRDPLRFSTFEPGKSKFFGYNTSAVPGRACTENMYDKAIQEGLDITRAKPFEISDESYSKPKTLPTQGGQTVVQKDINEITKDDLQKEVETYSKLLGGDEAKSQAIYDALLAASPAFFKGKNLREAAPEVLTAINKSGAFDKPRDIRQAAAQLAIQRNLLKEKAAAEEKARLAAYTAKNQKDLFDILKDLQINPASFGGSFERNEKSLTPGKYYLNNNNVLIRVDKDSKGQPIVVPFAQIK